MKDETKVALVGQAKHIYEILKAAGKNKNAEKILRSIEKKINLLKSDPQCGLHIRKKQIPAYYVNKYGITNLWKCNLIEGWRMIYWVQGSDIRIICFVLEILDHKKYERRFNY